MAAIRITTNMILKEVLIHRLLFPPSLSPSPSLRLSLPNLTATALQFTHREFSFGRILCAASHDKKVSSRLSQVHQLLREAEERASAAGNEPTPKITIDHVNMSFARSGGPGGQNVNKVNTKLDMRFNVKNKYWSSERIREKIMQTAIIDAASYVPPPPSEEQKKKIAKLAAIGERKRLEVRRFFQTRRPLEEVGAAGTKFPLVETMHSCKVHHLSCTLTPLLCSLLEHI